MSDEPLDSTHTPRGPRCWCPRGARRRRPPRRVAQTRFGGYPSPRRTRSRCAASAGSARRRRRGAATSPSSARPTPRPTPRRMRRPRTRGRSRCSPRPASRPPVSSARRGRRASPGRRRFGLFPVLIIATTRPRQGRWVAHPPRCHANRRPPAAEGRRLEHTSERHATSGMGGVTATEERSKRLGRARVVTQS